MPEAALPKDERERLAALEALKILDTERSIDFDIFPEIACRLFSTQMAAISLVDKDRQWFKASKGIKVAETPRDVSFCAHAILRPNEVLYVPDARNDPRFADNPGVQGESGIRFYAGAPVIGPSGHPVGAICVIDREPREVSKQTLETLQHLATGVSSALQLHASLRNFERLATTDPLTGLENRAGFERRLSEAKARCGGSSEPRIGLLLLDLDGLTSINDLFGHSGGDTALLEVARRLQQVTRARDTVARLGDDELCILVEDVKDFDDLRAMAGRVHAALAEPFLLDRQVVPLRTSIGIAAYPETTSDIEDLVPSADVALAEAKQCGGGVTRTAAAHSAVPEPAMIGRRAIRELLHNALHPPGTEPFALVVQPVYATQSRQLSGFEALVRWPRPDGSMLSPAEFIPVAEATGLVVPLDRWVLDQACALAASWPEHLTISSNLSAANFIAGDLVHDVSSALNRHALAPNRLKLEITETVLLRDPDRVRTTIRRLRDLGVRVVLDDFGAGHASIAYLRDYAFDGLKIDRSFIATIEADSRSRALIRAIITMAHALGVDTTAEGVETAGQLRLLRNQKVATVQGYLLGRPIAPREAKKLFQAPAQSSRAPIEARAIA